MEDDLRKVIEERRKKKSEDSEPRFVSGIKNQLTAGLLAEIEGIIYNSHGLDPSTDYVTMREARSSLTKLHASSETELSVINFEKYFKLIRIH